jgi:hypothetical protein
VNQKICGFVYNQKPMIFVNNAGTDPQVASLRRGLASLIFRNHD